MQLQGEQNQKNSPFEIIHNARTKSRASRSRKSSIGVITGGDKEKLKMKTKKLRKMTMNDTALRYRQIQEIDEFARKEQLQEVHSERGDIKQEISNNAEIEDYFNFGNDKNTMEAEGQLPMLELEKGISCGVLNQRDLDSDFDLGSSNRELNMEDFMKE